MVNSTFMHELNEGHGATVDARMVPLIKFLNRLNVKTVSSRYDEFCNVMFTSDNPMLMAQLMFVHLKAFAAAMPEGVYLEMSYDQMMGFVGIVELPAELLDDFYEPGRNLVGDAAQVAYLLLGSIQLSKSSRFSNFGRQFLQKDTTCHQLVRSLPSPFRAHVGYLVVGGLFFTTHPTGYGAV